MWVILPLHLSPGPYSGGKIWQQRPGLHDCCDCACTALLHCHLTCWEILKNEILLGASGEWYLCSSFSAPLPISEEHHPVNLHFGGYSVFTEGKFTRASLVRDNISQLAHIAGGICGGILGFLAERNVKTAN
ncbi:MAG: hypothetical protein R3B47_17195 [Bacteroidia bacterium]